MVNRKVYDLVIRLVVEFTEDVRLIFIPVGLLPLATLVYHLAAIASQMEKRIALMSPEAASDSGPDISGNVDLGTEIVV